MDSGNINLDEQNLMNNAAAQPAESAASTQPAAAASVPAAQPATATAAPAEQKQEIRLPE